MFQEQLDSQMQQRTLQEQQELLQQSNTLQQSLTEAQQQLQSKTEASAEVEASLQEAQQQLKQLQARVKHLDNSLHAAQAAHSASKQELKQKEQAQYSLHRENQNAKQQVQRLRQQLTQAQRNSADSESTPSFPNKVCISAPVTSVRIYLPWLLTCIALPHLCMLLPGFISQLSLNLSPAHPDLQDLADPDAVEVQRLQAELAAALDAEADKTEQVQALGVPLSFYLRPVAVRLADSHLHSLPLCCLT